MSRHKFENLKSHNPKLEGNLNRDSVDELEDEKLYSCLFISDEGISKLNSNLRTLPSLNFKNKFMQDHANVKNRPIGQDHPEILKLEESFLSSLSDRDFEEKDEHIREDSIDEGKSDSGCSRICSVYQKFNRQVSCPLDQENQSFVNSEVNKCTNKTNLSTKKNFMMKTNFFRSQRSYKRMKIEISHRNRTGGDQIRMTRLKSSE